MIETIKQHLRHWDFNIWVIASLVVLGLIMRIIMINAPLWYDEILTVVRSVRMPVSAITGEFTMNNHVFYTLQAKAATALFGEHNWSVRLPAVLFGAGQIAVIWALARRVLSMREAHVVAALTALSYHHVWFSQNARGYTELMFWCTLAVLLMIIGLQRAPDNRRWGLWLGFGACVAAALYTHLTSAFFLTALGLVYLLMLAGRYGDRGGRLPEAWKAPADVLGQIQPLAGFALGGSGALALYAPAFASLLNVVGAEAEMTDNAVAEKFETPLWSLLEAVRSLSVGGWLAVGISLVAGTLIVIGGLELARRRPTVPMVVFIHIPLSVAILMALSMRIWPRFFFIDLCMLLLLITHGVYLCTEFAGRSLARWRFASISPQILFGLASAAMIAVSLVLLSKNYSAPKQNWAGAMSVVEQARSDGDVVLIYGISAIPFNEYYHPGWTQVTTAEDFSAAVTAAHLAGRTTWAVVGFPYRTAVEYPEITQIVETQFALVRELPGTLGDGAVRVYRETP